ncbi:MAG: LD-carboxypeptidase [Eubacteriales bacterium]|nr:LD-carboxypeptidase [Eubacteriales bacterium]
MMQKRISLSNWIDGIHKAGIVCCSNGIARQAAGEIQQLSEALVQADIQPVFSPCLYAVDGVRSGSAQQRADCLMRFYTDPEIDAVFDISGGDIANELLPYLDYAAIAQNPKPFWGYSDLTVLLNAIYAMTGNWGVLYQMRFFEQEKRADLFDFSYRLVQGTGMSGTVVGGNIRCFLKLAGTRYFPDLHGKVLLLEARSGLQPQIITYLSQLQQLGALEQVNGILLGTFTQLETAGQGDDVIRLVQQFTGTKIPIAKTDDIGHAVNARAIAIGSELQIGV